MPGAFPIGMPELGCKKAPVVPPKPPKVQLSLPASLAAHHNSVPLTPIPLPTAKDGEDESETPPVLELSMAVPGRTITSLHLLILQNVGQGQDLQWLFVRFWGFFLVCLV